MYENPRRRLRVRRFEYVAYDRAPGWPLQSKKSAYDVGLSLAAAAAAAAAAV